MPNIKDIPRQWIYAALTVLLLIYLVCATLCSNAYSGSRLCTGVLITVHDTADLKFVTPDGFANELGDLPVRSVHIPLSSINLDSLEKALNALDNTEKVNVTILSNGKLHIDVYPMRPVARIFNTADGTSFYINNTGKRISANAQYHLDVPVAVGNFSNPAFPPTAVLPLVRFLSADSVWNAYVTMIEVRSPSDIFIIPDIVGHVVNVGDTLDLPVKFDRLKKFYTNVMPVKGWEAYDTISLKWGGRVVAHRRGATPKVEVIVPETGNYEDADLSSILAGAHPDDPHTDSVPPETTQ